MIQEKMKASQSRQKSYDDKMSKTLEFQEEDHVLLRVTSVIDIGHALKPKKLTLHFVSQLRKYIPDPSHVIQVDDVQVRENLTIETSPLRIEDREVKHLRRLHW
ncbi:uncharacterized protein LOC127103895 [Lathyrus oleraceus]|uniref:uncharacterized protein LOC127103895 n=1 Tax=Pisum sativum TaxID=3888 RepID=UPI0021D2F391|nr:uncharacterized protein LOC127103895 [Pisum sativum]